MNWLKFQPVHVFQYKVGNKLQSMNRHKIIKALIDCEIALVGDQELYSNSKYQAALLEDLNKVIKVIVDEYDGEFIISSSLGNATHNVEINIEVRVVES